MTRSERSVDGTALAERAMLAHALDRHGIADKVPAVRLVGTQEKAIILDRLADQRGHAPQVILPVIDTHRKHRAMPPDYLPRAFEGGELGALDVHLDVRRSLVEQQIIEPHTLHPVRPRADCRVHVSRAGEGYVLVAPAGS